jgi:predicted phosphoribosyltransferase
MNPDAAAYRLPVAQLEQLVQVQREEIARRQALYRQGRSLPPLTDRTIILVDDGIATGSTFVASVEGIRQQKPCRLIGAIPVGPEATIRGIRGLLDELVILSRPDPFWAVGNHYLNFAQVSDHDVVEYLNLAEQGMRDHSQAPSM